MRILMLLSAATYLTIAPALAQRPADGDLIVSMFKVAPSSNTGPLPDGGLTLVVNPVTGASRRLGAEVAAPEFHNWVRMASNNRDIMLVVATLATPRVGTIAKLDPDGNFTPLAAVAGANPADLTLDHDGKWVVAGGPPARMWLFDDKTHALQVLPLSAPGILFNGIAIDRDPGSTPYVIAAFQPFFTAHQANIKLFGTDRNGNVSAIVTSGTTGTEDPLTYLSGVEMNPGTGNYLTTALILNHNFSSVNRVTKTGQITEMPHVRKANGARFAQDGSAWVIGDTGSSLGLFNVDVDSGRTNRVVRLSGFHNTKFRATGVEVYGSRRLVVEPAPAPRLATVTVQSQRPGDGNKPVFLFWSLSRRPGETFPNGERLDLDRNTKRFMARGTTDASGRVVFPKLRLPPLPKGTTVFLGALIYDNTATTVRTVTNTHWFVMP